MPPSSAYNWLAVAYSAAQVLEHAARYRSAQVAVHSSRSGITAVRAEAHEENNESSMSSSGSPAVRVYVPQSTLYCANEEWMAQLAIRPNLFSITPSRAFLPLPNAPEPNSPTTVPSAHSLGHGAASTASIPTTALDMPPQYIPASAPVQPAQVDAPRTASSNSSLGPVQTIVPLELPLEEPLVIPIPDQSPEPASNRNLQPSRVPSSRIGRLFHYGGLAASLGYGAASELLRRSTTSSDASQSSSLMMTEANIGRLVSKLSQMRGAALKVGQFLSIQDTHVLPPDVEKVFRRVQDSAHYMPNWQMEKVLESSLGAAWRDNFTSFDAVPFAAASIGQVHRGVLAARASPTGADAHVAIKVQFPNIRQSVESDIGYLKALLTAGRLLPRGLFLDRTIAAMKDELADECDYEREASYLRDFGAKDRLGSDPKFKVPWVWNGSTDRVLVMEHVGGTSVGGDAVQRLSQTDRDDIAARILELCLKELFHFRAMQTDPNWSNFLWNARTRQVELVDFGATRSYSKPFMDDWLRLLRAAASGDFEACRAASLRLGYLTGKENELMLNAHIASMELLATPFRADTPQPFAFGPGTRWAEITGEIRAHIPVMLQHRLTPPPRETYSLNRKLSGAFLLASRLGARIDCRALWEEVTADYEFDP